jgi:hypothetical protein
MTRILLDTSAYAAHLRDHYVVDEVDLLLVASGESFRDPRGGDAEVRRHRAAGGRGPPPRGTRAPPKKVPDPR